MKTAIIEKQPSLMQDRKRILLLLAWADSILLLVFLTVIHFYLPDFDLQVDRWRAILISEKGFAFFDAITDLGNVLLVLPAAAVVLAILIRKKEWKLSTSLLVTVFGGAFFCYLLKVLFSKTHNFAAIFQPNNTELGFPSGHTMMALLFYGWLALLALQTPPGWKWKWPAAGLGVLAIFGIGFSRLMISVHLLSDVLTGWAAGLVWFISAIWLSDWALSTAIQKLLPKTASRSGFE